MEINNKPNAKNSNSERAGEKSEMTHQNQSARGKNLRAQYFLERDLIRQEIGDLEQIRASLGMSQRKICQLLLVDPSAWTRWLRHGAPPHIYQSLKWLLQLRKTNPEIVGPQDLASRVEVMQQSTQSKIQRLEDQIQMLERELAMRATLTVAQPTPLSLDPAELLAQEQRFTGELARIEKKLSELTAQTNPRARAESRTKPKRQSKSKRKVVSKKKAKPKVKPKTFKSLPKKDFKKKAKKGIRPTLPRRKK